MSGTPALVFIEDNAPASGGRAMRCSAPERVGADAFRNSKCSSICSQSRQYGSPDLLRRNPKPPQRSQYFNS